VTQLPNCVLPAVGLKRSRTGLGLVTGLTDGGLVGRPPAPAARATLAWDARGCEAGRRLRRRRLQLVRRWRGKPGDRPRQPFGVAGQGWTVAVDQATAVRAVAGLVPARRGPKGDLEALNPGEGSAGSGTGCGGGDGCGRFAVAKLDRNRK